MDHTRDMSMFYSGVEQETYYRVLREMGVENFLVSYHYVQNTRLNLKERFGGSAISLFVDSGAHTYQNDAKYLDRTVEDWEAHIARYLRWAGKNKKHIFAIANADFELVLDGATVDRWNRELFEPFMLETGLPVCFVWHENSKLTWEQYCQRYPYVGFSSNFEGREMEFREYAEMLKVAERYGSLVHGFGMTRTSVLPHLPYYSVDSTTWLAGLKYGEMNYWDGSRNRMMRLKKEVWKGEMFSRIMGSGYPFDPDRLMDEDPDEVIRASIWPYIQAERFIRHMHKKIAYWQKPRPARRLMERLPENFFPGPGWLETAGAWWLEDDVGDRSPLDYARRMNLSTSPLLSRAEIKTWVCYMTLFLNWDKEEYRDLRDRMFWGGEGSFERLRELHDKWVNRVARSDEDRARDLAKMFRDCLEGLDTKLLLLGTNFDRIASERDAYVDDAEMEEEEVAEEQVARMLAGRNLLPPPRDEGGALEVDALDDEIFSGLGLVTERRDDGTIVKWARHVPKPKKLYSDKYPKLACDSCWQAQRCPDYRPGHVCAYSKMFQRYDTRSMADLVELMQGMVDLNAGRMQRAMVHEVMSGGHIAPEVSQLINQNVQLIKELKGLYATASPDVLRHTKAVRADGSTVEETSLSGGGVLAQLMEGMMGRGAPKEEAGAPQNDIVVLDASVVDVAQGVAEEPDESAESKDERF